MPQSRAAMAVSRVLGPRPGERVLDLCAAPGGKTTHLAALMEGRGAVVAVERHPGRAQALARTAARMGASAVEVRTADAAEAQEPEAYDRVLVDPPCSDLGTLASRPDARWRKRATAAGASSPRVQGAILRAGGGRRCAPAARSCTRRARSRPRRTRRSCARFLAERPDFHADDLGSSPWSGLAAWIAADVPADAPPSRRHGRVLHRAAAPRRGVVSSDRRRPRRRLPRLRRALAAADEPARPLPLRELPAPLRARLGVPQLRRALHDRADVEHGAVRLQPLPRVDAGADLSLVGSRALDPVRRLRAARRAGADGARRGRHGHPRRRDGRPLRAADHDGPARGGGDRRAGARGRARVVDVHLMIERPERHVARVRGRRAPTASRCTSRRRRTCTTRSRRCGTRAAAPGWR